MFTELEKAFFKAFIASEYSDQGLDSNPWVWSVSEEFTSKGYSGLQFSGVVSSLTKKGLLVTQDHNGRGRQDDMYFSIPSNMRETIRENR